MMTAITDSFAEEFHFECDPKLEDVLRNPRMITVISHAAPLSWIPVIGFLGREFINHGGGDRVPTGVTDRWFYSNRITQKIAAFITQSETALSFEELVEKFQRQEKQDLFLMPEGANAFFGNVDEIRDFRSVRFIELAIRTGSPLFLVVHKGSENWSKSIPVPAVIGSLLTPFTKFFGQKLVQEQSINMFLPPRKMKKYSMKCSLYLPQLYESDLAGNEIERHSQLEAEAARVKELMSEMLHQLKSSSESHDQLHQSE
jgi:hypothetical protein